MNTKIDHPEARKAFAGSETRETSSRLLYRVGSWAALVTATMFFISGILFVITRFIPGSIPGWISAIQDNWLIVLIKLHAGLDGVQIEQQYRFNFLDLIFLLLVCGVYPGLYVALRRSSKVWAIVALVQPFIGVVLFIVTKSAGRSSVMGAALVISLVMLRSPIFGRLTALTGILASILLLVGDISAGMVNSTPIALLTGVGYVLLVVWFMMVGRKLTRLE